MSTLLSGKPPVHTAPRRPHSVPSPAELFGERHRPAPLIGLAGQKRAGKDTAAAALTARGWRRLAFADRLRAAVRALDPWLVSDRGIPRRLSELFNDGWDFESLKTSTYSDELRRCLERAGTEMGREVLGGDVWLNALEFQYRHLGPVPVVITDVRFDNEAAWIRSNGGVVVRVSRETTATPNPTHASDTIDFVVDAVLPNNGTIADLHSSMWAMAQSLTGPTGTMMSRHESAREGVS